MTLKEQKRHIKHFLNSQLYFIEWYELVFDTLVHRFISFLIRSYWVFVNEFENKLFSAFFFHFLFC